MDRRLRELERRASQGVDVDAYHHALIRLGRTSFEEATLYPDYAEALRQAAIRGEDLTSEEERHMKSALPRLMPEHQPVRRNDFPMNYEGFAVVEWDETEHWNASLAAQAGYIGGVYIVDLTKRVHIASLTPSYEMIPLHHSTRGEIPDELDGELVGGFAYANVQDVDYITKSSLRNAVDWVLVDINDYYDPDDDDEPIEQLRQRLQENWVL